MGIAHYFYFLLHLIEYKIDMFFAYIKYGKYWQALIVDLDYFSPYTFKLMAKSYYGMIEPWEEKLYQEIRFKHNNSHKDHWEYYVINNAPNNTTQKYEVAEVRDGKDVLYAVQDCQYKRIICLFESEDNAHFVCKKVNMEYCKPFKEMPDVYTALMIERWKLEGNLEDKLAKYSNGEYSMPIKKINEFAEAMYKD